jgi:predicted hydrolase (HD superfamily)
MNKKSKTFSMLVKAGAEYIKAIEKLESNTTSKAKYQLARHCETVHHIMRILNNEFGMNDEQSLKAFTRA